MPGTEKATVTSAFTWKRAYGPKDLAPFDNRIVDVAVLDMNHSWPNLGHDAIVRTVGEIARDIAPFLEEAGMSVRVLSFDVRRALAIPELPGRRLLVYLGTGGPGHLDPRLNDGVSGFSQGIREDPSWEAPLFRLFDAIGADTDAALIAVCHSFGVLCRWAGVAQPVLRGSEKGGKSSGVRRNALTPEGIRHPWFRRFSRELGDGRHFRILDNRLFDLIPGPGPMPAGVVPISRESANGGHDAALTMIEYARDRGGTMPRILAVNHHPEIRNRWRQRWLLQRKLERGEVTREWYEERADAMVTAFSSPEAEREVMLTSQFTFVAPLRFHLYRQVRLRAAELGYRRGLHEDQVLLPSGILDREEEDLPL